MWFKDYFVVTISCLAILAEYRSTKTNVHRMLSDQISGMSDRVRTDFWMQNSRSFPDFFQNNNFFSQIKVSVGNSMVLRDFEIKTHEL